MKTTTFGIITDSLILAEYDYFNIQTPEIKPFRENFLVYGHIYEKSNYSHPGIFFYVINDDLEILKSKRFFDIDTVRVIYSCLENRSQNLVILGVYNHSGASVAFNYLWELNSDFEVIRRTSFDFNIYIYLVELPVIPGYHIGGWDSIYQVGYDFSHQGVVFGKQYDDRLFLYNHRKALSDSTYGVCALGFEYNYPNLNYDYGMAIFNQYGKKVSQYLYGAPDTTDYCYAIDFISPDSILLAGIHNYIYSMFWGFSDNDTWLSVFNVRQDGTVNWNFDYGGDECYSLSDITATGDGGCLMIGTYWDWRNNPVYERDIVLVKVDNSGIITATDPRPPPMLIRPFIYPNPGKDEIRISCCHPASISIASQARKGRSAAANGSRNNHLLF